MDLTINGEKRSTSDVGTIAELLEDIDVNPKTIIVEQNGTILMKTAYSATSVKAGDVIELIQFVGGG